MTEAPKVTIRRATRDDADAIFLVLQACAPEIPVNLDGDERKDRIRGKIRDACLNGQSRVAVAGNQVIGFLLAFSRSEVGRFDLPYGGVLKNYRENHLFPLMLDEVKGIALRLDATVKNANQSEMASRLLKAGFVENPADAIAGERAFKWVAQSPLREG